MIHRTDAAPRSITLALAALTASCSGVTSPDAGPQDATAFDGVASDVTDRDIATGSSDALDQAADAAAPDSVATDVRVDRPDSTDSGPPAVDAIDVPTPFDAGFPFDATDAIDTAADTPADIATDTAPPCPDRSLGSALGAAIATGSTSGSAARFTGTCGSSPGPEVTFAWTAPADGSYVFDTAGSSFDTVLYLRTGTCTGAELGCSDNASGISPSSRVSVALTSGQSIVIIVDGYSGATGSYVLNIGGTTDPCAGVVCNSPPASICSTPTIANQWSAPGTCSGGTCNYPVAIITCARGCIEGVCGPLAWTGGRTVPGWEPMSVWGSGPNDVYVGGDEGGTGALIGHSIGDDVWIAQTTPRGGEIMSIWGSGASDIYAVGDNEATPSTAILFHSTGTGTWTQQTIPVATASLGGVWGSGVNDVYAVGYDAAVNGVILHSTGGVWSAETVPATGVGLQAVWGSGAGDVYAVGSTGVILHSIGDGSWTVPRSPAGDGLFAVWGSSAGDVYAVGSSGLILHSTGSGTWTPQTVATTGQFLGVWGSSANNVYVSGGELSSDFVTRYDTLFHSTIAGTWARQVAPSPLGGLWRIWGSGPNDVYSVGPDGTILHLH